MQNSKNAKPLQLMQTSLNPGSGTMEVLVQRHGEVWFGVAIEESKIIAATFGNYEKQVEQNLRENLLHNSSFQKSSEPSVFAKNILSTLKNIYNGMDTEETIFLNISRLPIYTQLVLKTVRQIPVGYISSYGSVAKAIGGGPRAVGNVMASNPFSLIVPCHRVVTSSLGLGGYGGGLRVKYELLQREKRGYPDPRNILVDEGGVLRVFPVELVLNKLQSKRTLNRHFT